MPGLSRLGDFPWFFFSFDGITGCGSASLKLCVCNAASPWSQSLSPDSQCQVQAKKEEQYKFYILKLRRLVVILNLLLCSPIRYRGVMYTPDPKLLVGVALTRTSRSKRFLSFCSQTSNNNKIDRNIGNLDNPSFLLAGGSRNHNPNHLNHN